MQNQARRLRRPDEQFFESRALHPTMTARQREYLAVFGCNNP
jgi:hypothetical protein